jgi:hypothetical protein
MKSTLSIYWYELSGHRVKPNIMSMKQTESLVSDILVLMVLMSNQMVLMVLVISIKLFSNTYSRGYITFADLLQNHPILQFDLPTYLFTNNLGNSIILLLLTLLAAWITIHRYDYYDYQTIMELMHWLYVLVYQSNCFHSCFLRKLEYLIQLILIVLDQMMMMVTHVNIEMMFHLQMIHFYHYLTLSLFLFEYWTTC